MSYTHPDHVDPRQKIRSFALAATINGTAIAALLLAPAAVVEIRERGVIKAIPPSVEVPLPPPPPPEQKQVDDPLPTDTIIDRVVPPLPLPQPRDPGPAIDSVGNSGPLTLALPKPQPLPIPEPRVPVFVAPKPDQRYASRFQPDYPGREIRAGREGAVTIRVLVGTDGRVRRTERVDATSDAFWQATEKQALSAWRFTPATRDGVPVEEWFTLTVRFRLDS
jgi:periplasmic protein TonB